MPCQRVRTAWSVKSVLSFRKSARQDLQPCFGLHLKALATLRATLCLLISSAALTVLQRVGWPSRKRKSMTEFNASQQASSARARHAVHMISANRASQARQGW